MYFLQIIDKKLKKIPLKTCNTTLLINYLQYVYIYTPFDIHVHGVPQLNLLLPYTPN